MVIPAPLPLMGYEMLQSMRFRVNPVSEELEEVPEDEIHPALRARWRYYIPKVVANLRVETHEIILEGRPEERRGSDECKVGNINRIGNYRYLGGLLGSHRHRV